MLKDIKLPTAFFLPDIPGKIIAHAKIMEMAGIGDHVRLWDIARSQIKQAMIPTKSAAENRAEIITCFVVWFSMACFMIVPSSFCTIHLMRCFLYELQLLA